MRDKVNNNLIERYQSTFRERDKVIRGSAQGLAYGYIPQRRNNAHGRADAGKEGRHRWKDNSFFEGMI